MKLLDPNGGFIRFLSRIADLFWLNCLFLVFSIPIITMGASFTALHYVSLKMVRDEETYITRMFVRSFKENFVQATLLELICLVVLVVLGGDFYLLYGSGMEISIPVKLILMIIIVVALISLVMVFPVQSKFSNTIAATLRNSLILGITQLPKVVAMIVMYVFPIALVVKSTYFVPVLVTYGVSLPVYLAAALYDKPFLEIEKKYEELNPPAPDEDEHIFSDEVIVHNNDDVN